MLYLAVQMPDKSLCRPECPVTVSVIQNAEGARSICLFGSTVHRNLPVNLVCGMIVSFVKRLVGVSLFSLVKLGSPVHHVVLQAIPLCRRFA